MLKLLDRLDDALARPVAENKFLGGPFGPVEEESGAVKCSVRGAIPHDLRGQLMRNGPNPKFHPIGGYHWFDGDGMVHSLRLHGNDTPPTYSCHYVQTVRLQEEVRTGRPQYPKIGEMGDKLVPLRILSAVLKTKLGLVKDAPGTANTSLQYHAGRLLALHEGDSPYAVKMLCDGVIETIGRVTFDGKLQTPFTAHPKLDPSTGTLYAIGPRVDAKPYCTFHVVSPEGELVRSIPLTGITAPIMMHDCAITERFAVILDLPFRFDTKLVSEGHLPFFLDKSATARLGLLPLDATDDSGMKWFELPEPVASFHVLNAWDTRQEGSSGTNSHVTAVDVVLSEYTHMTLDVFASMCEAGDQKGRAIRYTLDVASGAVRRTPVIEELEDISLDFPQVNKTMTGRRTRYGYWTRFSAKQLVPTGITKTDLQASSVEKATESIELGEGMYGGEAIFVPAASAAASSKIAADKLAEDDGYLVLFVQNSKEEARSEMRIYNARTMASQPVATVDIPARVPLGFHALWVSEQELQEQRTA